MKVEFNKHNLVQTDMDRVVETLHGLFLTTGQVVAEFEDGFADYLGVSRAVGVTSCTAALHLALTAHGVGPGDEVITTPMSFISSANAVLLTGATPVFVDVEPQTGNIDVDLIEGAITNKTKVILPVHLYGHMADVVAIRKLADRHGLVVIEDSAHAVEGIRDGFRPGQLGDAACFSFYAIKNLTSGEGGALVTNNEDTANLVRLLRLHGMDKGAADRYSKKYQHWDMEVLGFKYNMSNIQAAMLVGQLERIEGNWERREQICRRYESAFEGTDGIETLLVLPGTRSARHLFTILVPAHTRDQMLHEVQTAGVGVAVNFRPIHLLKYYRERFGYRAGNFPVAESIGDRTISLPLYPRLTDEEVDYVIDTVLAKLGTLLALGRVGRP